MAATSLDNKSTHLLLGTTTALDDDGTESILQRYRKTSEEMISRSTLRPLRIGDSVAVPVSRLINAKVIHKILLGLSWTFIREDIE